MAPRTIPSFEEVPDPAEASLPTPWSTHEAASPIVEAVSLARPGWCSAVSAGRRLLLLRFFFEYWLMATGQWSMGGRSSSVEEILSSSDEEVLFRQ